MRKLRVSRVLEREKKERSWFVCSETSLSVMEGRGGCCIARYASGGYDMSKVDRIMLRYRPIAPKPAAGGAVAGGSMPENGDAYVKAGRGKRRYVRDTNKRCNNRKRKASPGKTNSGGSSSGGETVVTLRLLPETPERKDSPAGGSPPTEKAPIWLSFDRREIVTEGGHVAFGGRTAVVMPQEVGWVGSWVTVECVTDTWVDGKALGSTDEERVMNMEGDTCPGLVSDGFERVRWTNKAYREMVGDEGERMMVGLVMKELVLLPLMSEAFTCRVRVTCRKERGWSKTLPCDVWRMDGGGYAWRLDIKAALCLGR